MDEPDVGRTGKITYTEAFSMMKKQKTSQDFVERMFQERHFIIRIILMSEDWHWRLI